MKGFILAVVLGVTAYTPLSAQTKTDTINYIVRESMEAQPSYDRSENNFVIANQVLYFHKQWIEVLDHQRHHNYIPIDNCDFYVKETEYGFDLMARRRSGEHHILAQTDGVDGARSLPECHVVSGTRDIVKVQKLAKAFNHLIELETGRKDLF